MITRQEYEDALKIVRGYIEQVKNGFQKINHEISSANVDDLEMVNRLHSLEEGDKIKALKCDRHPSVSPGQIFIVRKITSWKKDINDEFEKSKTYVHILVWFDGTKKAKRFVYEITEYPDGRVWLISPMNFEKIND